jgi:RNA recognition motif-containing protein
MASLIKCRKCGGPHVTLKCGKEKQDIDKILDNKFKPKYNNTEYKNNNNYNNNYNNKEYEKRKITTVRISNLPQDVTVEELTELISEWGKIGRVNLTTFENKSCFVDFYYPSDADYFVKAIDKTKFDYCIISAEIIKSNI